jgi:excisionase family DNA binding protein
LLYALGVLDYRFLLQIVGHRDAGAIASQKVWCGMSTSTDRSLSEVRFLTVAEVAALMRVSKMTVYRLVHHGELTAVRVGRSFRVPEQAVHDYLRDSYVETA